jgi:membrane protein DedA with SNARE-associated domain
VRRAVLAFTSLLFIVGTIGTNIGPALVDDAPAIVLTLSARNRNLFGSVPYIDPLPYAIIGFLRMLAAAVALYFVGKWYGHRALAWAENQLNELPATYRWAERATDRMGWLALLFMPGSNIVCLLVGHRGMRARVFFPIVVVGIIIRLIVMWVGGKIFEDQIRSALDFIDDYQWWVVGGLFAITLYQTSRRKPVPAPDPDIVDPPTSHTPHAHHEHVVEEIVAESIQEVETPHDRDIL